jgi:hypothetical protein
MAVADAQGDADELTADATARAGVLDGSGGTAKIHRPHVVAIRVPIDREPTAVVAAGISGSLHTAVAGICGVEFDVEDVRSIATRPVRGELVAAPEVEGDGEARVATCGLP